MPYSNNPGREHGALSIVIVVLALGFFVVAFVTPLFGWDPFRTLFDYAYSLNPAVTSLIVLSALGFSFWIDWRRFKDNGDKTLVSRLVTYGIIASMMLIFWIALIVTNGI